MSLIPMVVSRDGNSERSYDLVSRMMKDRIVFITGPIETNMAQIICMQLLFLASESSEEPINIYINSPGGEINAGLAIFDTMQFINPKCYTTVMGMAASMGSYLAMGGEPGHRYALPNAEILIHQPLGGAKGQCTDIQVQAAHIQKLKEKLTSEYAKRSCGKKTYDQFAEVMERDYILTPYEAMSEWGLVDHVVVNCNDIK